MDTGLFILCFGLFIIAILYSSVGHGGASGYLAILSITAYSNILELKQYAWCLNLIVAGVSFYHYYNSGYFVKNLTIPFLIGSVPLAFVGGYIEIDNILYDSLLSVTLVWAAYKLYSIKKIIDLNNLNIPTFKVAIPIGALIGFFSGVIGVGGGIFLSPLIILKKWASPKNVAATSAMFIWINSLSGLIGAKMSNQIVIEFEILFPFIISVLIGGYIGSKYGTIMKEKNIKKILIIVLLIAAMKRIGGLL